MPALEDVLGSRVGITVLRYLTAIKGTMSGREIAKRLGLQQSSARIALERLVEAGVIARTDVGRSAAYALNHQLVFVRSLLIPLFREEGRLREKLLSALAHGSAKLRPEPSAVILFGSVARGTPAFRDVDLLCVAAAERDKVLLHDAVAGAFDQVRREFNVPVSAVIASEAELRSPKLSAIVTEVRRDGLVLAGTTPREFANVPVWRAARGSAR